MRRDARRYCPSHTLDSERSVMSTHSKSTMPRHQPHFASRALKEYCWSHPMGFRVSSPLILLRKTDFQNRGAKNNLWS